MRGCSPAGSRTLQPPRSLPSKPPSRAVSAELLRIPASLPQHPRSRPAARAGGRLERAGGGGGVRSPEGEQEKHRQLVFPCCPPHPYSTPPSQIKTPFPVSPAHLSTLFQNPERLRSAPEHSEREEGSEARAVKKLPNLPTISQIPGSRAGYMAQERRSRRNKVALKVKKALK